MGLQKDLHDMNIGDSNIICPTIVHLGYFKHMCYELFD